MTLLVKDANLQPQSLSTQLDQTGNLVPVHAPATIVGGVAVPVSQMTPMPVINVAGAVAIDGSGTIQSGGSAQGLFGSAVPVNGYLVANSSGGVLYINDVGTASAGGASIPIAAGAVFVTPDGYKPPGAVSIYGASNGQTFAARRW